MKPARVLIALMGTLAFAQDQPTMRELMLD